MPNRFRDIEEIVETFKRAGYMEFPLAVSYISPFDRSETLIHSYKEEEKYKRRYFLEIHTAKEPSLFASIGETILGDVNVDLFSTAGVKIPNSEKEINDGQIKELTHWLCTRTSYLPTNQGLVLIDTWKLERKMKYVDKVVDDAIERFCTEFKILAKLRGWVDK